MNRAVKGVVIMCGRVLLESDIEEIIAMYNIFTYENEKYSAGEKCPGTRLPVVVQEENRSLKFFNWGFKIVTDRNLINARIETASERPTFREALYNRRCIIPVNAFYEWKSEGEKKIKYKVTTSEKKIISLAGIYSFFYDENKNTIPGFVVLTQPADENMSKLHHRMPVILAKSQEDEWLSKKVKDVPGLKDKLMNTRYDFLEITLDSPFKQITFEDLLS